jgi:hypothetical protein
MALQNEAEEADEREVPEFSSPAYARNAAAGARRSIACRSVRDVAVA